MNLPEKAHDTCVAQIAEALFGQPGLSLMEMANRRAEIEALVKDAERYTWLKKEAGRNKRGDAPGKLMVMVSRNQLRADGDGFTGVSKAPRGDEFDQSIDAAMKEQAE